MGAPAMTNEAQSTNSQFTYFRGYPGQFEQSRRESIAGALGCCGPFLLISLCGAACSAWAFTQTQGRWELVAFLGLLLFVLAFSSSIVAQIHVARQTSIVPYFPSEIGDIDTFGSGYAVARSCQRLDELAGELGLTPLSAFGFNDDMAGEPLIWHAASDGFKTVDGLLKALKDRPNSLPKQDKVIAELQRIANALRKASEQNVPFCLLLRVGDGTSGQEWEQRKGTCF